MFNNSKILKIVNGDNTLKYIINRSCRGKESSYIIVVNVGSADESLEMLGLAHLTEHLIFDWERDGVRNVVREILNSEGNIFAQTCKYTTLFKVHIKSKFLEKSIDVFSSLFQSPIFTEERLKAEKSKILKEIESNKNGHLVENVNKRLLGNYPYAHCTGGYKETLKNIGLSDVKDFFKKYYVLNNISIIYKGGCKKEIFVKKMNSCLSCLPKGKRNNHNVDYKIPNIKNVIKDTFDMSANVFCGFRVFGSLGKEEDNAYLSLIRFYVRSELEIWRKHNGFSCKLEVDLERYHHVSLFQIKFFNIKNEKQKIIDKISSIFTFLMREKIEKKDFERYRASMLKGIKKVYSDPELFCECYAKYVDKFAIVPQNHSLLNEFSNLDPVYLNKIARECFCDRNFFMVV